ncbi:acetyl-CoA synthetase [Burkholderia thailandensis]|uniref:Uncharacterized protein n=1 Tax=Burkholderia thailandensis TaxID=57975 RepID=A0AAW9CUG8_BURTH|nr:acetyl-CoA synthetase [Burkholderia thailandensis]AOI54560.1 acetyl-CoA synthetase [Burkholderia thailandensis]AOJ53534.1 acetyl-CoA synthetase [Burkholderia thailandensis]AVR28334.1 acetyl-CoA synthetase [Burkholderia thailandensis]MDD1480472.1 acetyl-CoA synthetase [Burkholderia thailandensis]
MLRQINHSTRPDRDAGVIGALPRAPVARRRADAAARGAHVR